MVTHGDSDEYLVGSPIPDPDPDNLSKMNPSRKVNFTVYEKGCTLRMRCHSHFASGASLPSPLNEPSYQNQSNAQASTVHIQRKLKFVCFCSVFPIVK
mmetsp:Transcript_2076/g.3174  ORF Transcript_2076/g.3174 Transcript_2076/m.3174 type:complete len:98 (-) Transcript_2076:630-923(-)